MSADKESEIQIVNYTLALKKDPEPAMTYQPEKKRAIAIKKSVI